MKFFFSPVVLLKTEKLFEIFFVQILADVLFASHFLLIHEQSFNIDLLLLNDHFLGFMAREGFVTVVCMVLVHKVCFLITLHLFK